MSNRTRALSTRRPSSLSSNCRALFVCILASLALAGCSISIDDGPAEVLSLDQTVVPPNVAFTESSQSKSGPIYRVTSKGSIPENSTPIFATALKSCTVAEGEVVSTITRRLFVGLEKIRVFVREQEELESTEYLSAPTLLLGLHAELDDAQLTIFTISSVVDGCAVDLALWAVGELSETSPTPLAPIARQIQAASIASDGKFLWELARQ